MNLVGALMPAEVGSSLPGGRGRRHVLVMLGFIAVLVILFVLLWLLGPLPQVFPHVPGGDGGFVPSLSR
jgi:hypothetical protein